MILLFQIMSCNRNINATLPPFTPTVISLNDVYGVMPSRFEHFKNTLLVSIDGESIEISKHSEDLPDLQRIKLEVNFKNISANSIVFRRPITYGFPSSEGVPNDLDFYIEPKNGPHMTFTETSNYPSKLGIPTAPKITLEDFTTIEPGDIFSYSVDVLLPSVYIEETKYVGKLPPGTYKLRTEYSNIDIGYELPLEMTPPATFDNWEAELEWYDNHTIIVDLNAWVGRISSDEVEFTMPTK